MGEKLKGQTELELETLMDHAAAAYRQALDTGYSHEQLRAERAFLLVSGHAFVESRPQVSFNAFRLKNTMDEWGDYTLARYKAATGDHLTFVRTDHAANWHTLWGLASSSFQQTQGSIQAAHGQPLKGPEFLQAILQHDPRVEFNPGLSSAKV